MPKRNVPHRPASTYYRLGAKLALLICIAILISSSLPGTSANTRIALAAAPDRLDQTAASSSAMRARVGAAQTAMARQDAGSTAGRRKISVQQKRLAMLRQTGNPELFA